MKRGPREKEGKKRAVREEREESNRLVKGEILLRKYN